MIITVTRAFCMGGKRQEVGSTIEMSDSLGRELIGQNKAVKDDAVMTFAASPKPEKSKEKKDA